MQEKAGRFELHIVHSNDLHSHLDRCAAISGYIRHLRQTEGHDHVIALDLGDHADRMHPVTEGTQGLVNIGILNQTGYDLITIGNNEGLLFDREQLHSLYQKHIRIPVLAANLFDASTGKLPEWSLPYLILQRGPLRIGWIGLTVDFEAFYSLLGWHAAEPVAIAAELAGQLRPQVDLLFIASHLGISSDRKMADTITGIDAIFGSHTHHRFEVPERRGNTLLFAAGKYGQVLGHAVFRWDLHNNRLAEADGRLISLDQSDWPPDREIGRIITLFTEESSKVMDETIAQLPETLDLNWYEESLLTNLTAHALRTYAGTPVSLVNHGVCLYPLAAGPLTRRKLLECCPSPINPCVLQVSGSRILQALEQAVDDAHQQKVLQGYGFRGKVLGTLAVDGLTVIVDRNAPAGRRIVRVDTEEGPLEADRHYQVATIDVFTFGAGYPTLGEGEQIQYIVPDLLREWLAEAACSQKMIQESKKQRWFSTGEEREKISE